MIDWFALGFGLLGLLNILSGCYGWNWWWRLARGMYLPDLVGPQMTRWIYIGVGYVMLAIGITLFLQKLFQSTSMIYWMVGFVAAGLITILTYNTRGYFDLLNENDDKDKKE